MNGVRLTLLLCLLPLSGCLDDEPSNPAPIESGPPAFQRVTIYSQELTLDSVGEQEPIPIVVPDDSVAVFLDLQYGDGAYYEANFSLGECHNVTPSSGLVVDLAGQHVSTGSATTNNRLFPCGDVPSGPQAVNWQVEQGQVTVQLLVHAEIPV